MARHGIHRAKRSIAALIAVLMVFGLVPVTSAAGYSDTADNWAKDVIDRWSSSGYSIVTGYEDGSFRPQNHIKRSEFAAILNRVMRYETTADNVFTDLSAGAWYYSDVLKVYAAGVTSGIGGGLFGGEHTITREQAFTMLSRMFGITENESGLSVFTDASAVSDWARAAVGGMAAAGYVQGAEGKLRPDGNLTRAEAIQVLDNIISAIYSKAGTYTTDTDGIVIVNADGVSLVDSNIGVLFVTQGIGAQGDFTLKNSAADALIVSGGGVNSITIDNSQVTTLTVSVDSSTGDVRIHLNNGASVIAANVASGASETVFFTNETGTIVGSMTISDDGTVSVSGEVGALNVSGSNVRVVVEESGGIGSLKVDGANATVEVKNAAEIKNVVLEASGAEIKGDGKVESVTVTENAGAGNKVTTYDTAIENKSAAPVAKDNTGGTVGSGESAVTPPPSTGSGGNGGGNGGGGNGGGGVPVITYPSGTAALITNETQAEDAGLTSGDWDWAGQSIPGAHWMIFDYTVGNAAITVTGFKVIKDSGMVVYDSGTLSLPKAAGSAGRVGIEAADADDTAEDAINFTDGTYKLELYYKVNNENKTLTSANIAVSTNAQAALCDSSGKLIKYGTLAETLATAETGQKIELQKNTEIDEPALISSGVTLLVPADKTLTVSAALTVDGTLSAAGKLQVIMASGSITGDYSGLAEWHAAEAWELKSALDNSREGDTIMITAQIGADVANTCVLHSGITEASGNDDGYYNFRVKKAITIKSSGSHTIYGNFTLGLDNGSPVEGAEFIGLTIVTPRLRFSGNPGSSKVFLYAIGGVTNAVTIRDCNISTSETVYSGSSGYGYDCVYRGISLVPTSGTADGISLDITNTNISFDQTPFAGTEDEFPLVSGLSGIAVMSSKYGNELSNWTGRYPGVAKITEFGAQDVSDALEIYDKIALLEGNTTGLQFPEGVDIAVWYGNGGDPATCVVTRGSRDSYNPAPPDAE